MNLDQPVDLRRYGLRPLWLLIAAAATRFCAERDAAVGLAGFMFWILVFLGCWNLRPVLRQGTDGAKRVEQAGNAVAGFGLLLFLLRLTQSDIATAVLVLLFAGQAALVIVAEKRLHVWLLLGAALAAVLFAASASRSALFLPCAAWFTFAALGLLTADHALDRSRHAVAAPTEAAGPAAPGSGAALFAVAALALALPLYLFMPRPGALLLGGMQATSGNDYRDYSDGGEPLDVHPEDPKSRLKSRLRVPLPNAAGSGAAESSGLYGDSFPIDSAEGKPGNNILMYVRSTRQVYLRGKVYDRFEGNRWFRDGGKPLPRELDRGYYRSELPPAGGIEVQQQIEVAAPLDPVIYAAPGVQTLRFPGPTLWQDSDGILSAPRGLLPDTVYSVESYLELPDGRYLVRQERLENQAPYLQLPADFSPRIRELAQRAAGRADGPEATALALEDYLRREYQYSFETIMPYQGYTPLEWFLFEHKRGHCEFFASAVVVMLRSLGIPARVASGFSLGEKNPITGFYEVHALDGHAWGEVYLPGRGWMMLEPTPLYPLPMPQTEHNQVAADTDRYLDRMAEMATAIDPRSLRAAAAQATRDIWQSFRMLQWQAQSSLLALGWRLPALMLGAALLGLCARLLWLTLTDWADNRRVLGLLAGAGSPSPGSVLAVAAALERSCSARGGPRPPAATFREFCLRLKAETGAFPAGFEDVFDDVRYGGGQAFDAGAVAGVSALVREQVTRQPWPRLSGQLRAWGGWLHAVVAGGR